MNSLSRIRWIAGNTFVEALRQRFFAFLILLCGVLAASSLALRSFRFGQSELKFIADAGFGVLFLFGSILAIVMTVQLFFSELDNRTALTLLAKPVRRFEFLFGKFFGIWALLGVFTLLIGAIVAALLGARLPELSTAAEATGTLPPHLDFGGLGVFLILQWLRLGVAAGVTLLVCSFARTFLYAVIVSTLAVLVCQLQSVAVAAFSGEGNAGWARALAGGLGCVIPDLQIFDLGVPLVLDVKGVAAAVVFSAAGYGVLYVPALLLLAVFLFSDREI